MQPDHSSNLHTANHAALSRRLNRARFLRRIRPTSLAGWGLGLLAQRKIVEAEGLRLYLDPTTHLGDELLSTGSYEPATIRIFRTWIKPEAVVLDIGANEGFFRPLPASSPGRRAWSLR